MRSTPVNAAIAVGCLASVVLLIASVWAADVSTATSLAGTGVLVLVAASALAVVAPRTGPAAPPQADAVQRERMRRLVP